jgi:hypothetical protein
MTPEEFIIWLEEKLRVSDNSENTIIDVRKQLDEVNGAVIGFWNAKSNQILPSC